MLRWTALLAVACVTAAQGTNTCVPGDVEHRDCNLCFCDGQGEWECTDLHCTATVTNGTNTTVLTNTSTLTETNTTWTWTSVTNTSAGTCVPGEAEHRDCNLCFCDEQGEWECTDIHCTATVTNGTNTTVLTNTSTITESIAGAGALSLSVIAALIMLRKKAKRNIMFSDIDGLLEESSCEPTPFSQVEQEDSPLPSAV